ncbi:hypothetical protein [Halopseudomonas formosensis]|uniref:Uncharacterized protein n=1 Tax=Halopseudomonas formosensis TaxID=1002526 RepID=A0ABU5C2L2_9GAMM|nr:hypothetical protein [Halopseudomonas formosensis]MDX9688805.1 hypothetical protein [Halopseudomonas formosensis]
MIKKLLLSIAAFLILGIGALVYLVAPYVATPKFIVKNEASVPVKVTAHWRDKIKELGELSPGTMIEFEVTDEAAMEFKAIYPNGRVASSFPAVYFTSGVVTNAVVTDSSIEVSTQL